MGTDRDNLPQRSSPQAVEAFLAEVAQRADRPLARRGRLLFAMDATASREPTWDRACRIQAEMFVQTDALGGLDVQLCHYRGFLEFAASEWVATSSALLATMTAVRCAAGTTQIERVLEHAIRETRARKVDAVVFVGDCMEEDVDRLCALAAELGLLGTPVFAFHEGDDAEAARAFREIARLSGGAYCRFDATSARELRDLLAAVAVYAAGGRAALEDFGRRTGGAARRLGHDLAGPDASR